MSKKQRPYTTGQVAKICHVTINAVKKWIAAGKLKAFQTPGGHFRVNPKDFETFVNKYRLDIKDSLETGKKRILVVDDDPQIVEYVLAVLETQDLPILLETANDGYEALIKIGSFEPDLLITDIRIPKVDGYEVLRKIKKDSKTQKINIIAMTAYGTEETQNILTAGANVCLHKPLKAGTLLKEVLKLIK